MSTKKLNGFHYKMFPLEREQIHSVEAIYRGVVEGLITNYSSFFQKLQWENIPPSYCVLPPKANVQFWKGYINQMGSPTAFFN